MYEEMITTQWNMVFPCQKCWT